MKSFYKILSNFTPLFWLVIIAVLVILLSVKGCGKPVNKHADDTARIAAIKQSVDSVTREWTASDKAKDAIAIARQKELDSINTKLKVTLHLLNASQRKAVDLATEVVLAKQNNDTVKYVRNCDTLAREVIQKDGLIKGLNEQLASKDNAIESMAAITNNRLIDAQKAISTLKNSFNEQSDKYNVLYKDYQKATKKAGRQYNVSIGAGYGIGPDGRLGPTIAIYVGRTILKL